jgi:hypothetical protein
MNVLQQYGSDHEFKSKADELKYKAAMLSWADRAEYFFSNPEDPSQPLVLYPSQRRLIHALQYGTDIEHPEYPMTKGSLATAGRQLMGKSTGCAAGVAAGMLDPHLKFGLFAHVEDKSIALMEKVQRFLTTSRFRYLKNNKRWSKQEIHLKNLSMTKSHTAGKSIEGGSFHYGIIDEAGNMEDRIIQVSILPTFRAIGIHWVMVGTPRGKRGVFWYFHEKNRRNIANNEPPRFQEIYMDPVKDGRATEEQLIEEAFEYGEWAAQEVRGQFIDASDLYFLESWIEYAMGNITRDGTTHKGLPYANTWNNKRDKIEYNIGIDFGLSHALTAFAVVHRDGNLIYLDYMKAFKDETLHLPILKRLRNDWLPFWKPKYIVPDGSGIGRTASELIQEIARDFPSTFVYDNYPRDKSKIGFIMSDVTIKAELFSNLRLLFERGMICLPSHMGAIRETEPGYDMYELKTELCNLQYEIRAKNVIFDESSKLVKSDRIVALALAVYPFKDMIKHKYKNDTVLLSPYPSSKSYEPKINERELYLQRFDPYMRRPDYYG